MHDHAQLHEALASGSVPRRRVLETLGLTAAAACAAGPLSMLATSPLEAAAQRLRDRRIFPVTHVNHFVLSVPDYTKARDLYVDLFGMRVAWDDGRQAQLDFGSVSQPNSLYVRAVPKPGEKAFVHHIAFSMDDFMANKELMKAEFERRGVTYRPDGEVGWTYEDPAGFTGFQITPVRHEAMFPGAAGPCEAAASPKCKDAYEAGTRNLGVAPKPGGKGFTAVAFSHMILHVPDVRAEMEFYRSLFGMSVIADRATSSSQDAVLRFGENTLYLRQTATPQDKPSIGNHFGFVIQGWNEQTVGAELERRGFKPKLSPRKAWTFVDPDGFQVDVAAAGLAGGIDQ